MGSYDRTACIYAFRAISRVCGWLVALCTGAIRLSYMGHAGPVYAVGWSPDGRYLASAGQDGTVRVWNGADGKTMTIYRGHTQPVKVAVWSPDGRSIASGGDDASLQVWQALLGEPQNTYSMHDKW